MDRRRVQSQADAGQDQSHNFGLLTCALPLWNQRVMRKRSTVTAAENLDISAWIDRAKAILKEKHQVTATTMPYKEWRKLFILGSSASNPPRHGQVDETAAPDRQPPYCQLKTVHLTRSPRRRERAASAAP